MTRPEAIAPKPAPYMPVKAKQDDQNTPDVVLESVRRIFGGTIDFDPCGNPTSIVRATRQVWLPKWDSLGEGFSLEPGHIAWVKPPNAIIGDGLDRAISWGENNFVNPPYDAPTLSRFMARAKEEAAAGRHTILLTKVKLIKGWHASVPAAPAVCFIEGRLTFGGSTECAPFDCALILWTKSRELVHRFALALDGKLGDVMFHR